MSNRFEVGVVAVFEAFHLMPGASGPEGQLHQHRYRMEVTADRPGLDEHGMVVDLEVFHPAVRSLVADLEGKDLSFIKPEDAEAVTVEVLSKWAHGALAPMARGQGAETLSVRVWESEDAFGGYSSTVR
ncbi:MAG TPA: 6-carboxytetrahydropterin synthase [Actinomycetota bacterium]|jgi:6-pyruvoyl-tetrahydropterin synthase